MEPRTLNASDICDQHITPVLHRAGCGLVSQIRREMTFVAGQAQARGKLAVRGKRKRVDYLLYHQPNPPLAVIEAKDATHELGSSISQDLAYSGVLDLHCVFRSNGEGFLFHDRSVSEGGFADLEPEA